jgi:hypothetical protein
MQLLVICRIVIPARSPDLNPIENIFNNAKRDLTEEAVFNNIAVEDFDEFTARVKRALERAACLHGAKTISSLPKRIKEVIRLKGGRSSY